MGAGGPAADPSGRRGSGAGRIGCRLSTTASSTGGPSRWLWSGRWRSRSRPTSPTTPPTPPGEPIPAIGSVRPEWSPRGVDQRPPDVDRHRGCDRSGRASRDRADPSGRPGGHRHRGGLDPGDARIRRWARSRTAIEVWASCSYFSSSVWSPPAAAVWSTTVRRRDGCGFCGIPIGMLAAAILVANNLRDIATDARVGKANPGGPVGPAPHPACSMQSLTWGAIAVTSSLAAARVIPVADPGGRAWPSRWCPGSTALAKRGEGSSTGPSAGGYGPAPPACSAFSWRPGSLVCRASQLTVLVRAADSARCGRPPVRASPSVGSDRCPARSRIRSSGI